MTLRDLGAEENYLKAYQDGIVKYPKQRVIYNTFMGSFEPKWFGENYDAIKMIVNDIQELNPTEKILIIIIFYIPQIIITII